MAAVPNGIFTPAAPGHSVATLVLIENSAAMVPRWPDLRDRYLPTLLGTMRMANPVVPIQVLWLMSCPADEPASPPPHGSRQFNQLPEVRFNTQPNNRISPRTMYHGAELLASTFPDVPTARHLIVVAASAPSESAENLPGASGAETNNDPWLHVRAKLCQENIHLHMILNPRDKTSRFIQLFYDIMTIQSCEEAVSWFPVDLLNYNFYLSTRQRKQTSVITGASNLPMQTTSQYSEEHQFQPPPHPPPSRAPLPRNNSYPPAGAPFRSPTISRPEEAPRPSLVKHLQKIHGLTKKRTYGLQPSRQPFIRDESLDPALNDAASPPEKYSPEPGSSSPLSTRPLTTRALRRSSGVNASRKTIEEPRRPRRSSVQFNPATRVSSPDSDSSTPASSPTSVSPMSAIAPITHAPMGMGVETLRTKSRAGAQFDRARAMLPPAELPETVYPSAPTSDTVSPPLWNPDEALQIAQGNGDLPLSDTFQTPRPQYSDSISPPPNPSPARETPLPPSNYAYLQPPGQRNYTTAYPSHQPPGGDGAVASSPVQPLAPTLASDLDKPFIFPEYEQHIMTPLPPGPTLLPPQPQSFLAAPNYQLPPAIPHPTALTPPYTVYPPSDPPTPPSSLWTSVQSSGGADYSHLLNSAVAPGHLRSNPHTSSPIYDNAVYSSEHSSSLQSWAGY
ncbi:hypothetical protein BV25DRAFT_1913775 [Artomyces pyxidatus]|uniref:Uncharacterized protein n=1 Tax=Artomyces pyxidatus TaxID=48021 RepID=A0ACB8T8C7_9AGAM|nr:hypothetical protein BV25DRAFT_1913775 [Artomyces pyxidatus]